MKKVSKISAGVAPIPAWAGAGVLLAGLLAAAAAGAQSLLAEKTVPLELAQEAAAAALAACKERGFRVSVAVVDRAGLIKVHLRGDGAGPHTLDSSFRKAYTALTLRQPTRDLGDLIFRDRSAEGLRDMNENILILGGGLPIEAAGEVVGGIGVGGAPGGDQDEACAGAGIGKIRDRLR